MLAINASCLIGEDGRLGLTFRMDGEKEAFSIKFVLRLMLFNQLGTMLALTLLVIVSYINFGFWGRLSFFCKIFYYLVCV